MAVVTDVETPTDHRTEHVSRVLAALSTGTTDGDLDREILQVALASDGRSLLDLPEVGLWLALTEIAHTESSSPDADEVVVIDLRESTSDEPRVRSIADESSADPTPVTTRALGVVDDDVIDVEAIEVDAIEVDAIEVEAMEVPTAEDDEVADDNEAAADLADAPTEPRPAPTFDRPTPAATPPPDRRRRRPPRRGRRQRLPPIVAGTGGPPLVASTPNPTWVPVAAAAPTPTVRRWPPGLVDQIDELATHLATTLSRPISIDLGDPGGLGTSRIDREPVDPAADLAIVEALRNHVRDALAEPLALRFPHARRVGDARPDPWWPPATSAAVAELDAYLRSALEAPLVLAVPDPTIVGTAAVDVHWPPSLTRQLDGLSTFLQSLLQLPTTARVPASRLAGACNGAEPDPYWPRHLVRSGTTDLPVEHLSDLPPAPRTSDQLEEDLQLQLGAVALIGEADLFSVAAETQISLARLVRREPLDRLGRIYPATLAAFLVHHTRLHPSPTDFDAHVPISALRRTNSVGLAFSEALVRLGKPVFREVEQRDEFDHRVRYLRRMQLHVGITPDLLPRVLEAVLASHWVGARSGREIAQDWLSAHRSVSAAVGDPTFRLLTRTDHGAQMLEALLDLVRWRWLDPTPDAPPAHLDPLPSALVTAAWAWLADRARPAEPWGESPRPVLRLDTDRGGGPVIALPRNSSRWHLNGELLGYGSAAQPKTVPLPTTRSGKWAITTGTARRASTADIGIQSADDDRIVLVFDESGRFHHHVLPLGGTAATVIAPAGSRIDGQRDRTLLVDRWIGFERIEVDLTGRSEITVAERGRSAVTVPVDHRLGAHLLGAGTSDVPSSPPVLLPRVVFRGHVPPSAAVEVTVADGATRRTVVLDDRGIDAEQGSFGFAHLLGDGPERPASLTIVRRGFEPSVHDIVVPATPSMPVVEAEPPVPAAVAPVRARVPVRPHASTRTAAAPAAPAGTAWVAPVPGTPADEALRGLVRPLALALAGDAGPSGPAGLLSARSWDAAIAEDLPRLVAWAQRHRRPLLQWRTTTPAVQNLDQLWTAGRRSEAGHVVLPLLEASLLSVLAGPRRELAIRWSNEARLLAPHLTDCALAFANAYVEVQRTHPESRFRPIDLV